MIKYQLMAFILSDHTDVRTRSESERTEEGVTNPF